VEIHRLSSFALVGVLHFRPMRMLIVRQHEEEVDRAENRENERLQQASEKRQGEKWSLPRDAEGYMGER
jgi:hypothetical protein